MDSLPVGLMDQGEIRPEDIYLRPQKEGAPEPELTDQAIVTLVMGDYNRARTYVDKQEWYSQWRDNDLLYQSPVIPNADDPSRARVSRFTVNNDVNTMADATKSGLFAQKPPFFLRKRGKTTSDQLKGWQALLEVLCDRMKLPYWVGLVIDSQALQGTGIAKGGWAFRERTVYKRKQKSLPTSVSGTVGAPELVHTEESDRHEVVPEKVKESYPWLQFRILGSTLFDPAWRTPNAPEYAGYVVDVDFVTWRDLAAMDQLDCYDIPSLSILKDWICRTGQYAAPNQTAIETGLSDSGSPVAHAVDRSTATSIDPLLRPLAMLSRWDGENVYSVLCLDGRCVVIESRKHGLGRVPHFTANWRNVANSGYGIGIGRLVGADQRIEQGVLNHSLNLLSYQMNPAVLYLNGNGNAPTGDRVVRAGGFLGVNGDDVRKGLSVMEMPAVPGEAWQMIQYSRQSSQETSGADSTFMAGNLGGKGGSSAARTATGAGRIAAKADGRVQTPVENVESGVMVPWMNMLIEMVRMYMPLSEVRSILSDKLGDQLAKQIATNEFLEAELEAEVLAGAKLAAKAAMAQQLPYLMQVFQQPQLIEQLHAEGKTVDLQAILDVLFAVSEYRNEDDIIRPMTDQEQQQVQQMMQAQSGGGQKAAADIQREQVKGQNAMALEDKKGQHQLAMAVISEAVKKLMDKTGDGEDILDATNRATRGMDQQMILGQGPSPLAGQ